MFRYLLAFVFFFGTAFSAQAQYVFRYSVDTEGAKALPPPQLSILSPNTGPTAGGQAVTLSGDAFYNRAYFSEKPKPL